MDLDDDELKATKLIDWAELDKDIEILLKRCEDSEELFETIGEGYFRQSDLARIRNVINALKQYREEANKWLLLY